MTPLEAARLYGTTLGRAAGAGQDAAADFGSFLARELGRTKETLEQGEMVARQGLVGRASVQEVVEAVTAAQLALERVTAVRDRVIAAYQEIMRMPI